MSEDRISKVISAFKESEDFRSYILKKAYAFVKQSEANEPKVINIDRYSGSDEDKSYLARLFTSNGARGSKQNKLVEITAADISDGDNQPLVFNDRFVYLDGSSLTYFKSLAILKKYEGELPDHMKDCVSATKDWLLLPALNFMIARYIYNSKTKYSVNIACYYRLHSSMLLRYMWPELIKSVIGELINSKLIDDDMIDVALKESSIRQREEQLDNDHEEYEAESTRWKSNMESKFSKKERELLEREARLDETKLAHARLEVKKYKTDKRDLLKALDEVTRYVNSLLMSDNSPTRDQVSEIRDKLVAAKSTIEDKT